MAASHVECDITLVPPWPFPRPPCWRNSRAKWRDETQSLRWVELYHRILTQKTSEFGIANAWFNLDHSRIKIKIKINVKVEQTSASWDRTSRISAHDHFIRNTLYFGTWAHDHRIVCDDSIPSIPETPILVTECDLCDTIITIIIITIINRRSAQVGQAFVLPKIVKKKLKAPVTQLNSTKLNSSQRVLLTNRYNYLHKQK